MGAFFIFTDFFWHLLAIGIAILAAAVASCTIIYLISGRRAAIFFAIGLFLFSIGFIGYAIYIAYVAKAT